MAIHESLQIMVRRAIFNRAGATVYCNVIAATADHIHGPYGPRSAELLDTGRSAVDIRICNMLDTREDL